jgi:hypothetical protein
MDESVVLHEIEILVAAIKEHGDAQEGGTWTIAFGKVRETVRPHYFRPTPYHTHICYRPRSYSPCLLCNPCLC